MTIHAEYIMIGGFLKSERIQDRIRELYSYYR